MVIDNNSRFITFLYNNFLQLWKIDPNKLSVEIFVETLINCSTDNIGDISTLRGLLKELYFDKLETPNHSPLNTFQKSFYALKPYIPRALQIKMRQAYQFKKHSDRYVPSDKFPLNWPIEDRYVKLQHQILDLLLSNGLLRESDIHPIWPNGKQFAFVLTHDIETEIGYRNLPVMVELEKKYGFRSIINVVPERYPIDLQYLKELQNNGFEIGIHGLKHDGKLFFSYRTFMQRATKINNYLSSFGIKGFRAPLTHRNQHWLQNLNMNYDMSYFDTDPFEPIPGGTMCIWPFKMGHFLELPYTLPQDNTIFNILNRQDIKIWKDKIAFIEKYQGMALVIVHPDYFHFIDTPRKSDQYSFNLYEGFLRFMNAKKNYWHALPSEVANWWNLRDSKLETASNTTLKIEN